MAYKLVFLPEAEENLTTIVPQIAKRVIKKLIWISSQKNPLRFSVPLHNLTLGDIRFRVGDYRAVAFVDRKKGVIEVAAIGHRREIYRK